MERKTLLCSFRVLFSIQAIILYLENQTIVCYPIFRVFLFFAILWQDDAIFVIFNSISVILERFEVDNERLCVTEPR